VARRGPLGALVHELAREVLTGVQNCWTAHNGPMTRADELVYATPESKANRR